MLPMLVISSSKKNFPLESILVFHTEEFFT